MDTASRLLRLGLVGCWIAAANCVLPAAATAATTKGIPFGLHLRPQPTGTDLNQLLPEKVGRFARAAFRPDTKIPRDEDLNVTYSAGEERVNVGFSITESTADAWEAVKTTQEEARNEKKSRRGEQYRVGKDPSFYHLGDFVAWTRGNYFYYAKASSPAVLEEFMQAFPY